MAVDRIDSVIDQTAIEAEKKYMLETFDQLLGKIKQFGDVKISFAGAKDLPAVTAAQKQLQKGQTDLTLAMKEFEKIVNSVSTKQAKLNAMTSESAVELAALSVAQQRRNQELKEQAKLNQAAAGSLDELRIKASQAERAFSALSEAERNTEAGRAIQANAASLDAQVKQLEQSTGNFKRNVGNYQGSAAIIVRALEQTRQKFQDLNRDAGASPEAIQQVGRELKALERITDNPQFLNVSAKLGDSNAELKFFTKSLIDMERQGLGSSESAKQLRDQLAELTDQIGDTKAEIKALASDTRGFDLFAESVSTLVATTQTFAGVQELVGSSNQDVAKSIQKLVAIQNVANGVQTIAEQLTKRGTAANKVYALVQSQIAIMTNASTSATQKFSAAIKLSGIGLLITGISFLITKLLAFGDTTKDATTALDNYNAAIDRNNDKISTNITKIQRQTELLVAQAKQRGATEATVSSIVIDGLSQQADLQKQVIGQRNEEFKSILKSQTSLEGIQKLTGDITITQEDYNALLKDGIVDMDQAEKLLTKISNVRVSNAFKGMGEDAKSVLDLIEKTVTNSKSAMANAQTAEFNLQLQREQQIAQEREKQRQLEIKGRDDLAKAELELFKFRQGLAIDEQNTIASVAEFGVVVRRKALETSFALQRSMIEKQAQFEIGEVDKQQSALSQKGELNLKQEQAFNLQRKLIREKTNQDIFKLESNLGLQLIQLKVETDQALKQEGEDALVFFEELEKAKVQAAQDAASKELEIVLAGIEQRRAEDRAQAIKNFQDRLTTEKQLQEQIQNIDANAQSANLQQQVIFYKDQLKKLEEAGVDTLEMKKKLAAAEIALQDQVNSQQKEPLDVQKDLVQQLNDKYLELGHTIASTFASIIGGVFDGQKNQLQDQIDQIDKAKAAEIDRINSTTLAAEEKAARIKIVEAKAQSDREAIDRKQREVDRRKALFEKAFAGFNIIASGIESVAKIKASVAELTAKAISNPLLLPLIPIAAAQIPISIALTAAQLVALAATPLPKFAHGTESAPAGLGIWGEAGQEMMVDRKGRLRLSGNQPSLVNLMGGETILPADVTKNVMRTLGMEGMMGRGAMTLNMDNTALLDRLGDVVDGIGELNRKPGITIINQRDITSTAWYDYHMKH